MEITASQDLRIVFHLYNGGHTIVENHDGQLRQLYQDASLLGLEAGVHYDFSFVEYLDEEGEWCDVRINDESLNGYTQLRRWFSEETV